MTQIYLNRQANIAQVASREASAAGRLRSSPVRGRAYLDLLEPRFWTVYHFHSLFILIAITPGSCVLRASLVHP